MSYGITDTDLRAISLLEKSIKEVTLDRFGRAFSDAEWDNTFPKVEIQDLSSAQKSFNAWFTVSFPASALSMSEHTFQSYRDGMQMVFTRYVGKYFSKFETSLTYDDRKLKLIVRIQYTE